MDGQKTIDLLKPHTSPSTQYSLSPYEEKGIGVQRWTNWKSPTFSATVKPANVQDLQAVVKHATAKHIPFLAVASGHGYSKHFEKAKDVLQIDLTNFNAVEVKGDRVTVGGAARFRDVVDPLFEVGKQLPQAGCTSTGIVGVTLGGGLNPWQGMFGLMIDSLLEVQLVTSKGELVTASKTTNPELFWGMRGAGFNFGIVVSATFQTYDLQNGGEVMVADIVVPFEKSMDVIKLCKQWEEEGSQPHNLAIASGAMWNPDINAPCHMVVLFYYGPEKAGRKWAQPIIDLGAMVQNVNMYAWNVFGSKWGMGVDALLSTYGGLKNLYSGHIKHFDLGTFEWYFAELKKLWDDYPACRGSLIFLENWATQRMKEVPDDETAYPHRDVAAQMIIYFACEDPALADGVDQIGQECRDRFLATSGFETAKVYVNYAQGDETQEALYGERKLQRLRALKRQWDPDQVFSWMNPIKI